MRHDGPTDPAAPVSADRVYLIEQPAPGAPSDVAEAALADADVILYDPEFASLVAALLPAGAYAEPLAASTGASPRISPRARQLAADGWRVVQLIPRRDTSSQSLTSAADRAGLPRSRLYPPAEPATASATAFTANGLAG